MDLYQLRHLKNRNTRHLDFLDGHLQYRVIDLSIYQPECIITLVLPTDEAKLCAGFVVDVHLLYNWNQYQGLLYVFTLVRWWNVDSYATVQQHLDSVQWQQQQRWLRARSIIALLKPRRWNNAWIWAQRSAAAEWLDSDDVSERDRALPEDTTLSEAAWLTLDLLVVAEPPDVGSWFAAWCGARQGDNISLHGRFGESCDLRSSWHSCGTWQHNCELEFSKKFNFEKFRVIQYRATTTTLNITAITNTTNSN